jgi:hypothetical protein
VNGGERFQKVFERIQEPEGWAEPIVEARPLDQSSEPVKREILKRTVDREALKKPREAACSLRDRLHRISTGLESSRPAEEAMV